MAVPVNMNNILNGKDSRWLQLEVCREFQRNKCSRQDTECKFAHPPANVEVQNGKVTACYDSIKGRCNRDKPPCKYFHPPQHLKDQLLINGRNHLALKNAIMQQMGIAPGQPVIPGQVPAVATNPYLTGIPANTYNPYFSTAPLVPLLGPDPSAQLGPIVPQAVQVAQQKIPRSDRLEAFSGMVPYKRTAAEKSGIPVYQPGANSYQQLMQFQQPFVPVSCEYQQQQQQPQQQQQQPPQQQLQQQQHHQNHHHHHHNTSNTTTTTTTTSATAISAGACAIAPSNYTAANNSINSTTTTNTTTTTISAAADASATLAAATTASNATTSLNSNTNTHANDAGVGESAANGTVEGDTDTAASHDAPSSHSPTSHTIQTQSPPSQTQSPTPLQSSSLSYQPQANGTAGDASPYTIFGNPNTLANGSSSNGNSTPEPTGSEGPTGGGSARASVSPGHNYSLNNNSLSYVNNNLNSISVKTEVSHLENQPDNADSSNGKQGSFNGDEPNTSDELTRGGVNSTASTNTHSDMPISATSNLSNSPQRDVDDEDDRETGASAEIASALTVNGGNGNISTATLNGSSSVTAKYETSSRPNGVSGYMSYGGGILPTPVSATSTSTASTYLAASPYQTHQSMTRLYHQQQQQAAAQAHSAYNAAVASSYANALAYQSPAAAVVTAATSHVLNTVPSFTYPSMAAAAGHTYSPYASYQQGAAGYYSPATGATTSTDAAALAKEVAQKNYANAVKMASSGGVPHPLSGKPLTAAAYTGMALNKSFLTGAGAQSAAAANQSVMAHHAAIMQAHQAQAQQQAAQAQHAAAAAAAHAQMRSLGSLPSSGMSTPVGTPTHSAAAGMLQRPASAAGYMQASNAAAAAAMMRPQVMPISAAMAASNSQYAAALQQQQQQAQQQGFFYTAAGMMPAGAAPAYHNPFASAAMGAPTMQPVAMPGTLAGVQQQMVAASAQPTTGSAMVVNPYKKMKTS